ncbi:putative LRR receptor-like serine/threonine-protein kinase [Capsicum chinense]|nr:putative LRR receptor-like serine/threonine-protein kinase [Capsicum chinense]
MEAPKKFELHVIALMALRYSRPWEVYQGYHEIHYGSDDEGKPKIPNSSDDEVDQPPPKEEEKQKEEEKRRKRRRKRKKKKRQKRKNEIGFCTSFVELWLNPGIGFPAYLRAFVSLFLIQKIITSLRPSNGFQIQGTFLDWTHGNSYAGGIVTSEIPNLGNLSRLNLNDNQFAGPLPVELSKMKGLKFLILAYNQFNGSIPSEYGDNPIFQALHLSSNKLIGQIPPSLGKLTSLLWLMLANDSLTDSIPPELGNCSSLLWLNHANNQLSGPIPPQLAKIGSNSMPICRIGQRIRPLLSRGNASL